MKWGCCSGTTGVFPFCFTQEAILFPGFLREFATEYNSILPQYTFNRTFFTFERRWVVFHLCLPLCLGDGIFACKKSGYCYLMLRTFTTVSTFFCCWRTHHKCPPGNINHFQHNSIS